MPNKRGPISKSEMEFIRDNANGLSPAEIAKHLERTEETIRTYMIEELRIAPDDYTTENRVQQLALQKELTNSPEWKALKDEFVQEELVYFKHRYGKLMAQFQDDVLATEETQIFLLIKYEILMQRNLKDTKRSVEDIERMEKLLQETYGNYPDGAASMDGDTKAFISNLENQLASSRVAKGAKGREYTNLQSQHSSIMKELKATRDQRFDRVQNSKQTLLDVIKSLDREDARAVEGRQMELVRIATEKERKRLSEQHTYVDGTIDQPLLTPETVI